MEWFKERLILFIVGFGLVFAIFSVKLIQNPYNYESSQTSRNQTELTVNEPQPQTVSAISSLIHKPVANPKPERDEWRSERDLEAQSGMAKWAKYMFLSSLLMVFLSAVGIWLILATLRATRLGTTAMQGALVEAKDATKAAWAAVDTTREVGQKQVRAYVAIRSPKFIINERGLPQIELNVKNTGDSPASDISVEYVSYRISLSFMDGPALINDRFSEACQENYRVFVDDLMAGQNTNVDDLCIVGDSRMVTQNAIVDFLAIFDNEALVTFTVECCGIVTYKDVFFKEKRRAAPFYLHGFDFDRDTKQVPLRPYGKLSVEEIEAFRDAYQNNQEREAQF